MAQTTNELHTLTLSELHERLKDRGITMALSKLSEFVNLGDVGQQLQVGGRGNRREFLPDVVDILAEFLPLFRSLSGVAWEAAPAYLRSFLKGEKSALAPANPSVSMVRETGKLTEHVGNIGLAADSAITLLERIAEAQERQAGDNDCVFDAAAAAQFLGCTKRLLRRCVPASFRLGSCPAGDRWYRRDLLSLKGGVR